MLRLGRLVGGGLCGESADRVGERGGLVEGDEGVGVLDQMQVGEREQVGEALAVFGWHDAVTAGPDDEGRAVEGGEAFGGAGE